MKADIWDWTLVIALAVTLFGLAIVAMNRPGPVPFNQSRSFHGHTNDKHYPAYLLKLKHGNDQTTRRP